MKETDILEVFPSTEDQDPEAEGAGYTTRLLENPNSEFSPKNTGYMSVDGKMAGLGAQQELTLRRHVYTHDDIEAIYEECPTAKPTLKERFHNFCTCNTLVHALLDYVPIVTVVKNYAWRYDLLNDFIAGTSVAFLHMPMGIALGLLASLPPLQGLYTTFFHVTIYMMFGTCPHVSMGTNALLSLLTANVVERELEAHMGHLASTINSTSLLDLTTVSVTGLTTGLTTMTTTPSPDVMTLEEQQHFKVGVAMSLAFISGAILLGMGLLKFGFLTSFLSASFLGGFTTASAVHIATSQVPKLFAIKIPGHTGAFKWVKTWIDIFKNLGDTNPGDLIVGLLSIFILLGVAIFINEKYQKTMKVPVPIHLILVIVSTLISHFADLNGRFGIAIVGRVGSGFEAPYMPRTDVMGNIASDAFVIAILAYSMTISLAKIMAKMHKYDIDDNQELVAYGLCNFVSSFFRCHPGCLAPPRTMLLSNAGAKTTVNGVFIAIFILIIIMAAGPLFVSLPIAVLAAMICVAVKNLLLQVTQLPGLWRTHKPDFIIWVATCLSGVIVDLDIGIIVGLAVSIFSIVVLSQIQPSTVCIVSESEDIVLRGKLRKRASHLRGVRVFYFPSQLYFANAEKFKRDIYALILDPASIKERQFEIDEPNSDDVSGKADSEKRNGNDNTTTDQLKDEVKVIVLDCSAITYIDLAGVNMLKSVTAAYEAVDIKVYLASCPPSTVHILEVASFFKKFPREQVVFDVFDALKSKDVKRLLPEGNTKL